MSQRPPQPPPPPPAAKKKAQPAKPPKPAEIRTRPVQEAIQEVLSSSSQHDREQLVSTNPFDDEDDPELGSLNTHAHTHAHTHTQYVPQSSSSAKDIQMSENPLKASPNKSHKASYAAVNAEPLSQKISNTSSSKKSESSANDTSNTATSAKESEQMVQKKKKHVNMTRQGMSAGEPQNLLYHKVSFSEFWMCVFLFLHVGQFGTLLVAAKEQLPTGAMTVLVVVVVSVVALVVYARHLVTKSRLSAWRNVRLRGGVCTPADEQDIVPDRAIECVAVAAVLEGIAYAIYSAVIAGHSENLNGGFFSLVTILQTIRFASIILLALHKIIRPANRIDPMRTIMELEVISICWDAIDGSTLFEILDLSSIGMATADAARFLMAFWYLSVGVRMALLLLTQTTPTSRGYQLVLTPPLALAPQPTVDRTFQGLRLRAIVIIVMAGADFYAAGLRISLWIRGHLSALQQDMAIKNIMFVMACSGAYDMYDCTITRNWNSRDLLTWPFAVKIPKRETQLVIYRWLFVVSYLLLSALMSNILIEVSKDRQRWTANIGIDFLLCLVFIFYCRHVHVKADTYIPSNCLKPKSSFVTFPSGFGGILGALMACSFLGGRIPALFYNYNNMFSEDSSSFATYNNALLLVSVSVVPIAMYGMFWAVAYMVFRKEFTAAPGNYNAIHDPVIQMVSTASMTEGALDVLSCSTFMQLAVNELPSDVNGVIVVFAMLEIVNACQSFALQCMLSGGHDDTPLDLVRWNASFRICRAVIDAGAIVLRVVLWAKYNAVSSVFLVKNLYNLVHTITQIERWYGVSNYPKDTLFAQFVSPQDWYGLNKEQWRFATSETVLDQARSGRRV